MKSTKSPSKDPKRHPKKLFSQTPSTPSTALPNKKEDRIELGQAFAADDAPTPALTVPAPATSTPMAFSDSLQASQKVRARTERNGEEALCRKEAFKARGKSVKR